MAEHLEVGNRIARGGMGAIFEVKDTVIGRRMAMKVCHNHPERFLEEATTP